MTDDHGKMTLSVYLEQYIREHDLKPTSITQLRITVRQFQAYCRKPLAEISSADINGFAIHLGEGRAKATTIGKVGNVATLMRAAEEDGLAKSLGRLQAAETLSGWFSRTGIKRCDWWRCFIFLSWDTALRVGDVLNLEFAQLRSDRKLVRRQIKTRRVVIHQISATTWDAIEVVKGQGEADRKYILPWSGRRESFYKLFRDVARHAGLPGTSKYLRRASGTQVCKTHGPAAAARHLGHADGTGALAMKYYVDQSQFDEELPMPPPLAIDSGERENDRDACPDQATVTSEEGRPDEEPASIAIAPDTSPEEPEDEPEEPPEEQLAARLSAAANPDTPVTREEVAAIVRDALLTCCHAGR